MSERTIGTRKPKSGIRQRVKSRPPHEEASVDLAAPLSSRKLSALQRTAGNHAVTQLLGGSSTRPTTPTVQRWAWVSGSQVMPDAAGLNASMKTFAADKVVRDYTSMAEFKDHAAGKTDYLGTLPAASSSPGTWVRFEPKGTNLLGENHTMVTLDHVVPAVGTTSFVNEQFATDDLSAKPAMKAAYETEGAPTFKIYGVAGVADKRQFGAESLFPKIAYALNMLLPYTTGAEPLSGLKPGKYIGQPLQRYLKIGWGYATDVADEVAALKKAKKTVPGHLKALAKVYNAKKADLDAFVKALPVDGYLGDALDTVDGKKKLPALEKFCRAIAVAMIARMKTDTELTSDERKALRKMPRKTADEQNKAFGKWRNLHFSHAVRDAVGRGVRYAGMGREHLKYLIAEGLPAKSKSFDMVAKDLTDFETLTKTRAASAKSP
jgi:hypothetical protein